MPALNTPEDPPPIRNADFLQSHSADHQSGCLRAGVPAATDNQRNEQSKDNGSRNLIFIITHRRGREHFPNKQSCKPSGALIICVNGICRYGASRASVPPDFLNIFGSFLAQNVDDVVVSHDSFSTPLSVDDGIIIKLCRAKK
jgi:hypothetical protein